MTITLPDETLRAVAQRAAEEGFPSAEEYVGHLIAMDLIEEGEANNTISAEDWDRSEADVAAGRGRPMEQAIRELAAKYGITVDEAG